MTTVTLPTVPPPPESHTGTRRLPLPGGSSRPLAEEDTLFPLTAVATR